MRIAAIYDVHGNLPALEAVLYDIRQADVDLIVIGGDVVPGPMPLETITCLLSLDVPKQFVRGNTDGEVLAWMAGQETDWYRAASEQWRAPVRWTATRLHNEHRRLMSRWSTTLRLKIHGLGNVLFCHATPRSDTEIFTRLTPEAVLLPVFERIEEPVIICGHTHMQFDRIIGGVRVVNAGSVGMPFGEPGAYWLQAGPDIQLRHTRYDLREAADRIRNTDYPQADDFAQRNVLQPPSEEEMLEAFGKAELKGRG